MLLQLLGDNIFPHFLLDHISRILIDLDNTVDWTVDILGEHITNSHCFVSSSAKKLNAL